jgi:photosystem II stability/assembly factor-like uncharacterized protein
MCFLFASTTSLKIPKADIEEIHLIKKINPTFLFTVIAVGLFLGPFSRADSDQEGSVPRLASEILDGLEWRCVGPANMGGRIDDFAVVENAPHIIYMATASGGVWKTTNNGVTWKPLFDDQVTSSIGDVTIAPSNPDTVWVGTGEPNNRQSSSWGNGVYKSTDGGMTWTNMGLQDTHHIGRIVVHPLNPDIVYVAALGHLWGPNKERGLFKTVDGGKSWVNTMFVDENTGFVDVAMDPENPDTLYAAAYQRRRRGWGFIGGGPGSGLFKTTNGGESWTKLTEGLPEGDTGRIGIDIYRSDPRIVYAVLEHKSGGVYRSEDKGFTWKKMSSTNPRPMYYSQIRIDPNNDQRIWVLGAQMYVSDDGGKKFRTNYVQRVHSDHHAMWINPENSQHIVLGGDGGISFSYDRGQTWDFVNTVPLGQFYEIGVDRQRPYFIYGGLQDNGSWCGPSATWYRQGISNDDWIKIGGGDGFYTQVDPVDSKIVYAESQNGNLFKVDLRTGERKSLRPIPENPEEEYRFNWNSPIHISPHNPKKIYYGGNKLFISTDSGETWLVTEDLTTGQDRSKLPLMDILPDEKTLSRHDGIAYYGDITTISESPLQPGLLFVGTDDGNLQVSRDGGAAWTNVSEKVPGVPKHTYVTRVVTSQHEAAVAYATFDGHRNNDFKPYVFRTSDYGTSWKNISGNLPEGGTVNVIREHHRNPNFLVVGTERGAYFSLDRGKQWIKFRGEFPTVPVDDIVIHPRENDLIFGTHGRSIWILDDITPLEQLSEQVMESPCHLFDIRPATIFNTFSHKGNLGHKTFVAPNPPFGAMISYYLKEDAKDIQLLIKDAEGNTLRELKPEKEEGINRVIWNLRYSIPDTGSSGQQNRFFRASGPFVLPGEYQVLLKVESTEMTQTVRIDGDPRIEVTREDRIKQHEALLRIHSLFPMLSAVQRRTDKISKEINSLKRALKKAADVPESITERVDGVEKEIADVRKSLVGDRSLGWRGMAYSVRGRMFMLSRSISGYTGAPSERQLLQLERVSAELSDLVQRINAMIERDIPEINRLLNENNIPRLFVGEPIKK